ncbi:MAG: 6-pyruvoyl-tetrahydropterin synthase-related protein, partial [Candidatus Omnitrophota bacterium]
MRAIRLLTPDAWLILAITVFSLAMFVPLFQGRLILGHDSGCAFIRLVSVYKFLGDGQLLVRWIPDLHYGYGYPLFNFYPPLFYYAADLLVNVRVGLVNAINLTCIFFLIGSGVSMYILTREFFGRACAFLSAIAYLYAPYHICDIYVRGSFAEASAFIFFPLIIWALYKTHMTMRPLFLVLSAVSIGGLMLTHNIMAMLFVPIVFVYIGYLFVTDPRPGKKPLAVSLIAFLLGVALAAFFWLPAIAEKDAVRSTNFTGGFYQYTNHFVYPDQLIFSRWGYGESVPGRGDTMSFQVGIIQIMLSIAAIALVRAIYVRRRESGKQLIFFTALLGGALLCTTVVSLPLWRVVPLLKFTQFPWRFLAIVNFAAAFLAGGACFVCPKKIKVAVVAVAVALLVAVNIGYCRPDPVKPLWDSATTNLKDLRELLACVRLPDTYEYLPIAVKDLPGARNGGELVAVSGQMR